MTQPIKAEINGSERLKTFWKGYFEEIPVCSLEGCEIVAQQVDAYFPYLDDDNLCEFHHFQQTYETEFSAGLVHPTQDYLNGGDET